MPFPFQRPASDRFKRFCWSISLRARRWVSRSFLPDSTFCSKSRWFCSSSWCCWRRLLSSSSKVLKSTFRRVLSSTDLYTRCRSTCNSFTRTLLSCRKSCRCSLSLCKCSRRVVLSAFSASSWVCKCWFSWRTESNFRSVSSFSCCTTATRCSRSPFSFNAAASCRGRSLDSVALPFETLGAPGAGAMGAIAEVHFFTCNGFSLQMSTVFQAKLTLGTATPDHLPVEQCHSTENDLSRAET